MSIKSYVGNVVRNVENQIDNVKTKASSVVSKFGATATSFTSKFSGGFTGMSESGFQQLQQSIETYVSGLESDLETACNTNKAKIDKGYKGTNIEAAVSEYIEAERDLFKAYVNSIRQEINDASKAYRELGKTINSDIVNDIDADTAEVKNDAQSMIDELDVDTDLSY